MQDAESVRHRWVIDGEALLAMLRRVYAGEDPEVVYAEAWTENDVATHVDGGETDA